MLFGVLKVLWQFLVFVLRHRPARGPVVYAMCVSVLKLLQRLTSAGRRGDAVRVLFWCWSGCLLLCSSWLCLWVLVRVLLGMLKVGWLLPVLVW